MKKLKSPARLRWEEEFRLGRIDEKWEQAEEFFSRPTALSPRAMSPSDAHALSQAGAKMSETGSEKTP